MWENIFIKPQTLQELIVATFKVQREYTNWEEITVEADTQEEALDLAQDDEDLWEYAIDASSYNYTGEYWVGEEDE